MKAVITGAAGHIGVNLIHALLQQNWQVAALLRGPCDYIEALPVTTSYGEITNLTYINEMVRGADVVFHLAGVLPLQETDEQRVWEVNVEGTKIVVDACLQAHTGTLVFCSTVHAFADVGERILDELSPIVTNKKAPVYDRSKATAQQIVIDAVKAGLNAKIICPPGVLGPRDYKPSAIGSVVRQLLAGQLKSLIVGGAHWVDVRDVANAMVRSVDSGEAGDVFILSGHYRTVQALAEQICNEANVAPPWFVCPVWMANLAAPLVEAWSVVSKSRPVFTRESVRALQQHRYLAAEKMNNVLGISPRPFAETIRDTVAWHQVSRGR